MADCYCYIVQCADGTFYTGWSTDPNRRLQQHNRGRGAAYTRSRRPVRLAYVELQPDRSSAMRRERAIKALPRARKVALIAMHPHLPLHLPDNLEDQDDRRAQDPVDSGRA
ncbi:MAG TPA: GIY-YIG nuclease family protein [Anaerolineales bacterium]|nr:GIY-YIG nuclease family protein [Anaerolineales bacterium]